MQKMKKSQYLTITSFSIWLIFQCMVLRNCVEGRVGDPCSEIYYIEPKCVNHPDGYGCKCGPGFEWNQQTCMSSAVDSRLEFDKRRPVRYSLLLSKGFKELSQFTVVMWVKTRSSSYSGTVFSYLFNQLRMRINETLILDVPGATLSTKVAVKTGKWQHLAWTWKSRSGKWKIYLDGKLMGKGRGLGNRRRVEAGGEFVVGQSSRPRVEFDTRHAFLGDIAHLHIWDSEMSRREIREISSDCTLMYCGNIIQWTDLRYGTRGAMRLRWPSTINNQPCFTDEDSDFTCNKYCSDKIGAQCNKDIVENIVWPRTRASHNMSVTCPGQSASLHANDTSWAIRQCTKTADNDGRWQEPNINDCISDSLFALKENILSELNKETFSPSKMTSYLEQLLAHISQHVYHNPVDISTVIDLLQDFIAKENSTVSDALSVKMLHQSTSSHTNYPRPPDTIKFAQTLAKIVDILLDSKNKVAWNATNPPGSETAALMMTLEDFSEMIANSLKYHVEKGHLFDKLAQIEFFGKNIGFRITSQWVEDFSGISFPDKMFDQSDKKSTNYGKRLVEIFLPSTILYSFNSTWLPVFVGVSSFRFPLASNIMPHISSQTRKNSQEDNINTPVVALFIHTFDNDNLLQNLSQPITVNLSYLNMTNISNPACVRLIHRYKGQHWHWSNSRCFLIRDDKLTSGSVTCACYTPGVFAVTTDMYDENWDRGDKRPILMNATTYIGCSISILSCLLTFFLLIYLRTASSTAHLHKNLSIAIACSQLCFMIGIDRVEHEIVCRAFAVLIHYFVQASFSWIMNEAFNLYIVITYSAHSQSHSDIADGSSRVRYYVLGWITPIVLVAAFVGSEGAEYYSTDMCLISVKNIWFFVGPILGIIVIIILVLIFTAKEHNENSYTKTERTNKTIMTHMKAMWTQVIILTSTWAFAFTTVQLTDPIIKYIYAIINCLQGSFFFVFYFLLHDEVRAVFRSHRKKRTLVMQGYDYVGDDASLDSYGSYNLLYGKDIDERVPLDTSHAKRSDDTCGKKRAGIEASSEESDNDMPVTSV